MGRNQLSLSIAVPALSLFALAGLQSAPVAEPSAAETLPVLEVWYLVPAGETVSELEALQNTMRDHAGERFPEFRMTWYERTYSDEDAYSVFLHYRDLAHELEGRSVRGADREWARMFEETVELVDDDASFRSILLPIAGPAGDPQPLVCRTFSRSRVSVFHRIEAQRRAKQLVDHLNATYEELNAYAYMDDLGVPYDLYLFTDHAALWERNPQDAPTSWEATRREFLEDERFAELQARLGEVLEEPISEIVTLFL